MDMIDIPDTVFDSLQAGGKPPAPSTMARKMIREPEPEENEEEDNDDNEPSEKASKKGPAAKAKKKVAPVPEEDDSDDDGDEDTDKPDTKLRKREPAPRKKEESVSKLWKLKAGGKEVEFDASDEEKVKRYIEKGLGADEVFQNSATMRKQAETFFETLRGAKNNPRALEKILGDPLIGADFKQIAKDYVWEMIQEEQELEGLSPEQRKWREDSKRLAAIEEERARNAETEKQRRANEEKQRRTAQIEKQYEDKIIEALEVKGVPRNPKTVSEMVWYIEQAIENNYDISANEIAAHILEDKRNYFKANFDSMKEDDLAAFIGEHNVEKLRKWELKKLKSTTSNPFQSKQQKDSTEPRARNTQPKKLAGQEWGDSLRQGFLAQFK